MSVLDPTPKTHGRGLALLQESGVVAEVGLCREAAVRQNAAFFKAARVRRPLVTAKWAMSVDGKIATRTGHSRWISGPEARRMVHELRGRMDAVAVGARTAMLDDARLTCRDAERRRTATRIVVCGSLAPGPESQLLRTLDEAPVLLAHVDGRPPAGLAEARDAGCEALALPAAEGGAGVAVGALLDELGRRKMSNVLLEGGSRLLGSFFDAGLVDYVTVFVSPVVVGGTEATTAVGGLGVASVDKGVRVLDCQVSQAGRDAVLRGWTVDPVEWVS
jgi:diaminohydroxyphosphoribosylaminopyrimidine deaminase/5-amino-6-(5-phosphoribosylamino)uracil reductase